MSAEEYDYDNDSPDGGGSNKATARSRLLQKGSRLADYPGAKEGDYVVFTDDGRATVYPSPQGVIILPIMFYERALEWPMRRSTGAPPIAVHDVKPVDADWTVIDAQGKKGIVRKSNGNKIEETTYIDTLIGGADGKLPTPWLKATFAFNSTGRRDMALPFMADCDNLVVEVDGKPTYVCVALYRLFSAPQTNNDTGYGWSSPRYERTGVLGEPKGPTIEMVRVARALRMERRAIEKVEKAALIEKRLAEQPALLAAMRNVPLIGNTGPVTRGPTTFTSGASWADPKLGGANPLDPNDNIDDLPWPKKKQA
jgi:hypothetical protein